MLGLGLGLWLGSRGAVTPAWTPTDLGADLLGFWDAERADKFSLSAALVNSWTDLVGSYAPSQSVSASKPVYSATSFNNRPGVTFDGTDDFLELGSVPFPTGAGTCEIWALVDQKQAVTDTTARILFGYGGDATATRRAIQCQGNNTVVQLQALASNGSSAISSTAPGSFVGRNVARGIITATQVTAILNNNAGTANNSVPATGTARLRIGAISNLNPGNYANVTLNALLVTKILTADQRTQLLTFLNARGGLP